MNGVKGRLGLVAGRLGSLIDLKNAVLTSDCGWPKNAVTSSSFWSGKKGHWEGDGGVDFEIWWP